MAKTDQFTLDLINRIQQKKLQIASVERAQWVTHCLFSVEGDTINLQIETSVLTLVSIAAALLEKEASYNRAAVVLFPADPETGFFNEYPTFSWGSSKVSEWMADIKLRIGQLQVDSEKKKLAELEVRLNKIISPELRAKMELEAIANEIS